MYRLKSIRPDEPNTTNVPQLAVRVDDEPLRVMEMGWYRLYVIRSYIPTPPHTLPIAVSIEHQPFWYASRVFEMTGAWAYVDLWLPYGETRVISHQSIEETASRVALLRTMMGHAIQQLGGEDSRAVRRTLEQRVGVIRRG